MISIKHKAIFVHIPRTGGHCISIALNYNIRERKLIRHAFPITYIKKYPKLWNNYFKFTFIRNPYDRLISAWIRSCKLYTNDWKIIQQDHRNRPLFVYNEIIPRFNYFVEKQLEGYMYSAHFRPQNLWFENASYDFVGNFDNLKEDLDFVCNKLHINNYNFRSFSSTKRLYFKEYYNKKSYRIVKKLYEKDFMLWEKYK